MSRHDLALAQESFRGHGTFSPLLTANVCITRHETFNSMHYYYYYYYYYNYSTPRTGVYTEI